MSTVFVDDPKLFSSSTPRSRNKLLAALPREDYQRMASHLRSVPMSLRQVLQKQDEPVEDVYFPNGGACALVKILQDGLAAEVATIGAEGAIGSTIFFGHRTSECDVLVQVAGPGMEAVRADVFNSEMERRGALFNLVIRFNQALMNQIMQTTACNGLHSAEQRCCRWLLMTHDRAGGNEFTFTHEFLATMLGVRRPTVTLVAASLQAKGLIRYRRGYVTIVDRAGLEAASCECYHAVRSTWERLLPELGALAG